MARAAPQPLEETARLACHISHTPRVKRCMLTPAFFFFFFSKEGDIDLPQGSPSKVSSAWFHAWFDGLNEKSPQYKYAHFKSPGVGLCCSWLGGACGRLLRRSLAQSDRFAEAQLAICETGAIFIYLAGGADPSKSPSLRCSAFLTALPIAPAHAPHIFEFTRRERQ